MRFTSTVLAGLGLLASLSVALPTQRSPLSSVITRRNAGDQAASQLLEIAPTSSSCSNPPAEGECATADQAAPFLIQAFNDYKIYSPYEMSAILALVAFETAEFKYNRNHFPGRPGQGTRNMQMGGYNVLYALSIPELQAKVKEIAGVEGEATLEIANGLGEDVQDKVLELVLEDKYSWGSAAWFYLTYCGDARDAVKTGSEAGFGAYMQCVGVTADAERTAYYTRALSAFGLAAQ